MTQVDKQPGGTHRALLASMRQLQDAYMSFALHLPAKEDMNKKKQLSDFGGDALARFGAKSKQFVAVPVMTLPVDPRGNYSVCLLCALRPAVRFLSLCASAGVCC